jgi:hypothetical protein
MLNIKFIDDIVEIKEEQVLNVFLIDEKKMLIQFCDLNEEQMASLRNQYNIQQDIKNTTDKETFKKRINEYAMICTTPSWKTEQTYIKNMTEGKTDNTYFAEILIKFKVLLEY